MKFKLALLAVKSTEVSKKFYNDLFDQEVVMDLGWNVTFSGGFAIQENFHIITSLAEDSIFKKSNSSIMSSAISSVVYSAIGLLLSPCPL